MVTLLKKVKAAVRVADGVFLYDEELTNLILAALQDLSIAGIVHEDLEKSEGGTDFSPLIERAVITYCRCNFGSPANYDRLKESYDEQKAQLSMCSEYTDFTGEGGR